MHRLSKQLIVLLLAVFVTAGMSLSVVQASNMSIKMMGMASSMAKSSGGCKDCGGPGESKGMATCAASGCVSPAAVNSSSQLVLDMASVTIYHSYPDLSLLGLDSRPEPYPPRTSNIG
jgi:hypothetical protein